MADTHLQLNADGTTAERRTTLWPNSESLKQEIIRSIFEQQNWKTKRVENISGSHWRVETACGDFEWKINLYISSIRDESRQLDEFKMQLGTTYPDSEEEGWINLVLGIYTVADGVNPNEYILSSGYDLSKSDLSTNPSLRGTRTSGLQKAKIFGMCKTEYCVMFRPDFLYYYIESQVGKAIHPISSNLLNINAHYDSIDDVAQYVTAIRTKPFLLLAGISGTGKSRIVRELARACNTIDVDIKTIQKPSNFEIVQVKPNWHDSSELIGYVSRIQDEIFIAGGFLKFIAKAWQNLETPFFLCLDEMNLAPVEQYFAEFLSVIESRKLQSDGKTIVSDPILKPEYEKERDEHSGEIMPKKWYKILVNELLSNCPDGKKFGLYKQFIYEGISIPQNLIIVGTVNMDETTYSFSRKVLDRAMTIEMNKVDLHGGLTDDDYSKIGYISSDLLLADSVEGKDVFANYDKVCLDVISYYLQPINNVLEGTPFKIAYRTRNEFLLYVVNNLNFPFMNLSQNERIVKALDEVTSMKILSRIEGDESKIKSSLLDDLQTVITSGLKSFVNADYYFKNEEGKILSISLAKLRAMNDKLKYTGYTSFWD